MFKSWLSPIQFFAIMLIALVAGSTFGIWRGYNPEFYAASTFIEVHQGTVRGLNFLLPAIAFGATGCTAVLAYAARKSRTTLLLYLCALALMISAGIITRFINQPINAVIMNWSENTIPSGWQMIRDQWWHWHILRTLFSVSGLAMLIIAVFHHRAHE